ncbi:hypothetical protein G3545_09950 [Starkeya sp. ORNL1]|uniref:hypothetical protein n=1 Tax=Starkeya sp. ORNL1 TaxID=2709380 RepID=UPI001464002F|nr:hypothetical protein [Starkeya sp. ORNL1]QJP13943.1 hypothetical protein G3545_09950 [Starkeya sp. ORNL1]
MMPFPRPVPFAMPRARLIAVGALHVDTPDLALALAHVESFAAEAGFECSRLRAEPYPKLGPHARVTLYWRLPEGMHADDTVSTALDEFCANVAGPKHVAHRTFFDHSGVAPGAPGIHDERILDARTAPFARSEFLWLHIEINTCPVAQADLRVWALES